MAKPYHRNPRQITKAQFERLGDTLLEYGDLGGLSPELMGADSGA